MEPRRLDELNNAERPAIASLLVVGVLLLMLGFGLLVVPLLGVSCLLIAVLYVLAAVYIGDHQSWAALLGLVLSCIQLVISLALCGLLFMVVDPPAVLGVPFLVVLVSVWMIVLLIRCYSQMDKKPRRGFELVFAQPAPVETIRCEETSHATAPTQR